MEFYNHKTFHFAYKILIYLYWMNFFQNILNLFFLSLFNYTIIFQVLLTVVIRIEGEKLKLRVVDLKKL